MVENGKPVITEEMIDDALEVMLFAEVDCGGYRAGCRKLVQDIFEAMWRSAPPTEDRRLQVTIISQQRQITDLQEANTRYLERARTAESLGADMAKALEPFANESRFYGYPRRDWADESDAEISQFTCGDLRAARAAREAFLAKTAGR